MTGEEMQRAIAFVLEQQAQLTATVGRLSGKADLMAGKVDLMAGKVDLMAEKVDLMAGKVDLMAGKVDVLAEKVDRNAEGAAALLAIAEIHERELRDTNERLNALINIVERHISEGHNGKA